MYNIGEIFRLDEDYKNKAQFCNANNLIIVELEPDEQGRLFQIQEPPQPTKIELIENEIYDLKCQLKKWKEDVEQVELFGMERADYEDKKTKCAEIIVKLRELEKELKEMQNAD